MLKKLFIFITCLGITILIFFSFSTTSAFAHSGRTDSNGGHHDYNNVSGLGDYHYHHGHSAHLHTNGICPYDSSSSTPKSYGNSSSSYNSNYSSNQHSSQNNSSDNQNTKESNDSSKNAVTTFLISVAVTVASVAIVTTKKRKK